MDGEGAVRGGDRGDSQMKRVRRLAVPCFLVLGMAGCATREPGPSLLWFSKGMVRVIHRMESPSWEERTDQATASGAASSASLRADSTALESW